MLSSGCYKDDCSYNPTRLTYVNNTIDIVDNFGKAPQIFNGDSMSYKTFGIYFRLNFLETIDPNDCYWMPDNAPNKIKLFTIYNFNSNYPANSNITSAFTLLKKTDEVPGDLTTNYLGKYNYFLLNESPTKDTLQQFIIISFNSYNDTVSVDTTRAILLK